MADEKDNEDFAAMFDEAPDGPASTDGDDANDEPGYGLNAAPHERDAKEAEAEFNRLAADEVSVAPVSAPGEVKAQPHWNGKSFTTKLKGETSAPAPKAKAAVAPATAKPEPKVYEDGEAPITEAVAAAKSGKWQDPTPQRESTSGIGPKLTFVPKPGARSIYEDVGPLSSSERELIMAQRRIKMPEGRNLAESLSRSK